MGRELNLHWLLWAPVAVITSRKDELEVLEASPP